jgi:hypothetical protein
MDFYIIIVPALVLSLCMLLHLLILKGRDKYLFAELRQSRDLMSVIREKWLNLSKEEYHQLRRLIEDTGEAAASVKPVALRLTAHKTFKELSEAPEKTTIEEQREAFSKL